jgi:hypothetical protein
VFPLDKQIEQSPLEKKRAGATYPGRFPQHIPLRRNRNARFFIRHYLQLSSLSSFCQLLDCHRSFTGLSPFI